MATSTDLFARRNRARIAGVVLIAALNYVLAYGRTGREVVAKRPD